MTVWELTVTMVLALMKWPHSFVCVVLASLVISVTLISTSALISLVSTMEYAKI